MDTKVAVAIILVMLGAIALVLHLSTTDLEFSRYNHGWTGTSDFFAEPDTRDAQALLSFDDLSGRRSTLLLIVAPDTPFSGDEAAAMRDFLAAGNTVFLADETGLSDTLIGGMGIRVHPGDLSSAERAYQYPYSVISYSREDDPILTNVMSITLNRPSSLEGGTMLVSTTPLTWDDTIRNGRLDANETLASYPILARETVGNGTLYVFSDPSIFINGMQEPEISSANDLFIHNLLSLQPDILVEQSHSMTGRMDPLMAMALAMKNTMVIKISALLVSLLLVAVAFWRKWI